MSSEYENYLSESEKIWNEYYHRYGNSFSPDGILNPKEYFESNKLKVMFLLMENYNKGDWNIIETIDNTKELYKEPGNGSRCWAPNIIRTLLYTRDEKWIRYIGNGQVAGTGFAYLNIKKHDEGNYKSCNIDLDANAKNDRDLLNRQIIACSPDVVFCAAKENYNRLKNIILDVVQENTIHNIAHIITYKANTSVKQLLAIEWFHPSRNSKGWSVDDCKLRIDELRPWIKSYSKNSI